MTSISNHIRPDVLVVPAESVARLYRASGFHDDEQSISEVLDAIARCGRYFGRDWAEYTESVKQIVAYGMIRNGTRILCLRRAKKSNRKALRLRYTVLIGGHVDSAEMNEEEPVVSCLIRELDEELGIKEFDEIRLIGVVVDTETVVGRLHLGLIYDVPIKESSLVLTPELDNGEFVNASNRKEHNLRYYSDLVSKAGQFDPWSELTLSSVSVRKLLCATDWFQPQLPLPFMRHEA